MNLLFNYNVLFFSISGLTKCLENLSESDTPGVFLGAWRALHNINLTTSPSTSTPQSKVIFPDGVFPLYPPCRQQVVNFINFKIDGS